MLKHLLRSVWKILPDPFICIGFYQGDLGSLVSIVPSVASNRDKRENIDHSEDTVQVFSSIRTQLPLVDRVQKMFWQYFPNSLYLSRIFTRILIYFIPDIVTTQL